MSTRFGLAAQALGVAALGAIVYFAFLAPSDPNPLSGIEVDGNVPAGVTPENEAAEGPQRNRSAEARRGIRSGGLARIRLVPVVPGAAGTPGAPGSVPPTVVEDETPVGEQYDSAPARVLGRVARDGP